MMMAVTSERSSEVVNRLNIIHRSYLHVSGSSFCVVMWKNLQNHRFPTSGRNGVSKSEKWERNKN